VALTRFASTLCVTNRKEINEHIKIIQLSFDIAVAIAIIHYIQL